LAFQTGFFISQRAAVHMIKLTAREITPSVWGESEER